MAQINSLVWGLREGAVRRRMREITAEAMDSDRLAELLQLAGADGSTHEANAALKAVIAERIVEYTTGAMKEANRRGIRLGAAAIVIAARKR